MAKPEPARVRFEGRPSDAVVHFFELTGAVKT